MHSAKSPLIFLSEAKDTSLMAFLSFFYLQMVYPLSLSPSAPWPWLACWQWSLTRWVGTWDKCWCCFMCFNGAISTQWWSQIIQWDVFQKRCQPSSSIEHLRIKTHQMFKVLRKINLTYIFRSGAVRAKKACFWPKMYLRCSAVS